MAILGTLSNEMWRHLSAILWTVTYLLDLLRVKVHLRCGMVVNADNISDVSLTFAV